MNFPHVTPVFGRPLCYHVQSRSKPGECHFVDITNFDGSGSCTCGDWSCRCVANMKKPFKPLSDAVLCEHLRDAHLYNLSVQIECSLSI